VDLTGLTREQADRAFLRALGLDPETHTVEALDGIRHGLRVRGADGKPVRFMSWKQLKRPEFSHKWATAWRQKEATP